MKKRTTYFLLATIAVILVVGFLYSVKEGFQNSPPLKLNQQPWKTVEELRKQIEDVKAMRAKKTPGLIAAYNKYKKTLTSSKKSDPKTIEFAKNRIKEFEKLESDILNAEKQIPIDIEESKKVLAARMAGIKHDKRIKNPRYTQDIENAENKLQEYTNQLAEISKLPTKV